MNSTRIDLCKLRPGDVIFSREPTWLSRSIRLLTLAPCSHAMIVLYPDVWFETTGAGAGFKLIEKVECYEVGTNKYAIVTDLAGMSLEVWRPKTPPPPSQILSAIQEHITLRYPNFLQFVPLIIILRPFPRVARALVRIFSGETEDVGGYCSQLVSRMLKQLYGIAVGGPDDHISPGMLRKRLLKCGASKVNCLASEALQQQKKSERLAEIYASLLRVTAKLRGYQYPHDRASFEAALAETFQQLKINEEPKNFGAKTDSLRHTLTRPRFFRLHELVWPSKYT